MKISVGIVDDHQLFLKSLELMLSSFENFVAGITALNGDEFIHKIKYLKPLPDIVLIDVNMPVMDGVATATWLSAHYPGIKLIAVSMNDTDKAIIAMVRAGCCAYLLKDTHPNELEKALNEVAVKGFYNADASNINFRRLLQTETHEKRMNITDKEKRFLQLASSDLTYKQIAAEMKLSERTIDGYRESLFEKLNVQSRVGMVLEGLRRGLVEL